MSTMSTLNDRINKRRIEKLNTDWWANIQSWSQK